MSYDLTNDAENPSGQRVPGISHNNMRRVRRVSIGLAAIVLLILVLW